MGKLFTQDWYTRVEALLAMALSRASGGAIAGGGRTSFLWQPNGTAGEGIFTTWAPLAAAIKALKGAACDVTLDTSRGTAHITSGVWAGITDVTFVGGNATPIESGIFIDDGATFTGTTRLTLDGLTLEYQGTAAPFISIAGTSVLVINLVRGATVAQTGGQPVARLAGTAELVAFADQISRWTTGTVALASAGCAAEMFFFNGSVMEENTVTGGLGGLEVAADPSSIIAGVSPTQSPAPAPLQVLSAAPGTPLWNPQWFAAGTIFVDPQNASTKASDNNSGVTSGAPLLTFAEAVRRWGSDAPLLVVSTTVTFLSSHTDQTDPVLWFPQCAQGAVAAIVGTVTNTAAVFTRSSQKSRVSGANALLAGSFSAGAPAAGALVQNTTAGKLSRAWVYKSAGGANWDMSQPFALQTIPQSSAPVEVDTWATNDTVEFVSTVLVNVVAFAPILIDFNAGFDNGGYLSSLTVFDPSGAGADNVYLGAVTCQDVLFQRTVEGNGSFSASGSTETATTPNFYNCFFAGSLVWSGVASVPTLWGGVITTSLVSPLPAFAPPLASAVLIANLGGDVIFGAAMQATYCNFGNVYLDGTLSCPGGFVNFGGVVYGSAGHNVDVRTGCKAFVQGGSFTAAFTAPAPIAGILLDGAATGNSIAYAANVGTIHNGITTSVANLDAAAGAAGFGGTAFNFGGSSMTSQLGV